jgi:Fe-S oxidoreductase
MPVIGLEPSCLLSFRDEVPAMINDERARQLADQALTFEEFLAREATAGRLRLPLKKIASRALVHGHCHQKAFDAAGATLDVLRWIPGLEVEPIESSCCGMAGAFGYGAETFEASMQMAELSLLPAVRSSRRCAGFRSSTSRRSNRAAAAWPAHSATPPLATACRCAWPSSRCFRPCARRRTTR